VAHETVVYGMIYAGEIDLGSEYEIDVNPHHNLNRQVLASLPEKDDFPALNRNMFAINDKGDSSTGIQLIHFAASYDTLEKNWHGWIEKFENLLKQLYWFSAVVHLESEMLDGEYQFQWMAKEEAVDKCLFGKELRPIDEWEFWGEPRKFDI